MIFSHLLTQILWVVPLVFQLAIAAVMLRRRLTKIFPVFFSYTVLVLSRDIVLLFLPYPKSLYSLVYWCGEALAVLLGLGVIFETLRHLLPPYRFLRIVLKSVWILGALAAVTAMLMLVFSNGGTGEDRVLEAIILLERAARFLQVCLLVVMITLMSRLGLTWHQYSLGIVAGFGVYSALDLLALDFRAHLHFVSDNAFVLIRPAAYNLAAVIWAAYFLPSWSSIPLERLPKNDLREWNQAVTDYVDQWHRHY
ncbi:MAG: hypothetical protein DMG79_19530 [Acidobacteria bacterium]|nr:MAG: hypothetical protein DMG79_19530 [Acidobacteriota bacterium]